MEETEFETEATVFLDYMLDYKSIDVYIGVADRLLLSKEKFFNYI